MHSACIHAAQPSHCTHVPSYDSAALSCGSRIIVPHGVHAMRGCLVIAARRARNEGTLLGAGQGWRRTQAMTSTVCTGRLCQQERQLLVSC